MLILQDYISDKLKINIKLKPLYQFPALETVDQIAVSGYRAFLPCDLTPPNPSEVVYLVLWYKGDEGEPIYRCISALFGLHHIN